MNSSVPFILVAAAALCCCANAHSWTACTDYRGDMNYYQDSECMSYLRGWNTRCDNPGCTDDTSGGNNREKIKGFFIAKLARNLLPRHRVDRPCPKKLRGWIE